LISVGVDENRDFPILFGELDLFFIEGMDFDGLVGDLFVGKQGLHLPTKRTDVVLV
jgi:hypothetical protein